MKKKDFLNGKLRNGAGFSLLELLVSVGIIAILSAIILPDFKIGDKLFALQRAANKVSQDLRRTQELSMSSAQFSCPEEGKKVKGYGIYFVSGNFFYILKVRCVNGTDVYIDKEQIFLEKGVKIKELKKDNLPVSSLSIFFYPPDPEVDLAGANEVKIILSLGRDIIISANKAGLINVE